MKLLFVLLFSLFWNEIKEYYKEEVNSIYAEFDEILYTNNKKLSYKGKIWVKKEGYMKFVIYEPDTQVLFVRKNKIFLYNPKKKTETEIFSAPYLPEFFMLQFEKLYQLYKEEKKADTICFFLKAKDENKKPLYDKIKICFKKKEKKPYKLYIESSSLKVKYELLFKKWIINPFIKQEIFKAK